MYVWGEEAKVGVLYVVTRLVSKSLELAPRVELLNNRVEIVRELLLVLSGELQVPPYTSAQGKISEQTLLPLFFLFFIACSSFPGLLLRACSENTPRLTDVCPPSPSHPHITLGVLAHMR